MLGGGDLIRDSTCSMNSLKAPAVWGAVLTPGLRQPWDAAAAAVECPLQQGSGGTGPFPSVSLFVKQLPAQKRAQRLRMWESRSSPFSVLSEPRVTAALHPAPPRELPVSAEVQSLVESKSGNDYSAGYQGMVDGGSNIVEADWESVSSILQVCLPTEDTGGAHTFVLGPGSGLLSSGHIGRDVGGLLTTTEVRWSNICNT
ncbi:hypothetical protein P7K49_014956 [Saguinus oedipus]|uniref:Uncharacterized protein n=1 Tax=Saguinus oedipus TaxID=9490 RepID=A0ABQ9VAK9_SAGOE|nr:hypothetical protein P7K49_014956 [Saguinus oedipus]